MKKSELKTGMLVELRLGYVYLVINDTLVSKNSEWMDLGGYEENLCRCQRYASAKGFDIMRVSKVLTTYDLYPKYWTSQHLTNNLLWERNEGKSAVTIDGVEYSESTLRSLIKKATGGE